MITPSSVFGMDGRIWGNLEVRFGNFRSFPKPGAPGSETGLDLVQAMLD